MDAGVFHDAHEVYRWAGSQKVWLATFATKGLAENWVELSNVAGTAAGLLDAKYVIVPV